MANSKHPNVLFIMADQFRHDYMSCAGADFVETPNMDRIAAKGVRFTHCYTNSPVCSPARIGLAAGMMPSRLGSLGNNSYLPLSATTYYQRLRDAGYRAGCVGKLDLAKPDPYNGHDGKRGCIFGYGFTDPVEIEGKMHAGTSPTPRGPYGYWLEEQGLYDKFHQDYVARRNSGWIKDASHDSVLPAECFADAYIGHRAVEWLTSTPDDFPWHCFVSFAGPHDPFDPPTTYAERYRERQMPPAIKSSPEGKPLWTQKRRLGLTEDEVAVTRRQYCASITAIDDQVGAILDALEKRGEADNTYVIFSSDHGEMLGDHGTYTKSVPYEGAVRVPLIAAGPGIDGGGQSDALVELIDINPTICELAGLGPQPNIDARSICPVIRGESTEHRDSVVYTIQNFRAIRNRTHKYVENYNDLAELYDLVNDPDEQRNIASSDGETASALYRQMTSRFREGKWNR